MRVARAEMALVAILVLSCSGRTITADGSGGTSDGGGGGGTAGMGAAGGGTACKTADGVRLCGGSNGQCASVSADECPGGGCTRPYDRLLGGDAVAGVCFSDLADLGSRSCWSCGDGEVCVEREPGELVCVPESVCAGLWALGAKGVCRYTDLGAYDGSPIPVPASCPNADALCGGACGQCASEQYFPCKGRSPDHPAGFCGQITIPLWCAVTLSGVSPQCVASGPPRVCGVFHHDGADAEVAKGYGHCMTQEKCAAISASMPGGFDCYDMDGKLMP